MEKSVNILEKKVAREILKRIVASIFSVLLKKFSSKFLSFLLTGVPGMIAMAVAVKTLEGLATIGVQLTMNKIFFDQVDNLMKKDLLEYNEVINKAYGVVFSKEEISNVKKQMIIQEIKLATEKLVSLKEYVK